MMVCTLSAHGAPSHDGLTVKPESIGDPVGVGAAAAHPAEQSNPIVNSATAMASVAVLRPGHHREQRNDDDDGESGSCRSATVLPPETDHRRDLVIEVGMADPKAEHPHGDFLWL
jgi:hypothetical protein